ncbi:hypothetical protein [Prosthecochloris sp.]|uniref:hypothetical protein n=1 Tax=Prosthecochloris sp. TaxID=290513 RepID=UPI0025E62137|nr:hypothetical protein [Prosthecochloris sp.]
MTKKIDNRKFSGIYDEIVKMLDPDGKRGLTARAVRDQYYRGKIEILNAHKCAVKRRIAEKRRDEAESKKITESVKEMIES